MYVFTRTRSADPKQFKEASGFAIELADRASKVTGLDVSVWTTVMSGAPGTYLWGCATPDMKSLHAALDKLFMSDAYTKFLVSGMPMFTGQAEDVLSEIVHGTIDTSRPAQYLSLVTATCVNGHVSSGIAAGIEIAQRAEKATGRPSMFFRNVTGQYGGVGWSTGFVDFDELEKAQQKLGADHEFAEFVDREALVYQPSAPQTILRRLSK